MYVTSVNLGKKDSIKRLRNGNIQTGINKRPMNQRIDVNWRGLVGDAIINTKHHGGPDQAVYVYREEDYRYWRKRLDRHLPYGFFGENLTITGLPLPYLNIGDQIIFDDLS